MMRKLARLSCTFQNPIFMEALSNKLGGVSYSYSTLYRNPDVPANCSVPTASAEPTLPSSPFSPASAGKKGHGRSLLEAEEEEMSGGSRGGAGEDRGLFWKLPVVTSKELGKVGPGMGLGAGCGVGFGLGVFGGAGLGVGFPGLQFGFGVGAGCGVGLGFGYGVGRGVAVDEHRRYSNVGHPMGALPSPEQLVSLADELFENAKKLVKATSKTVEKWRS